MTRILIEPEGTVLSSSARFARTAGERRRGLLGRPPLLGTEALIFERAKQIHTFGMAYALDVVFCDGSLAVLHVARSVPPRRVTRWVFGARHTIEMVAGSVPASVDRGTRLVLSD